MAPAKRDRPRVRRPDGQPDDGADVAASGHRGSALAEARTESRGIASS